MKTVMTDLINKFVAEEKEKEKTKKWKATKEKL